MKKAILRVSPEMLRDALNLPVGCEIEYALLGASGFRMPVEFVVTDPSFRELEQGEAFPIVDAVFQTVYDDDCTKKRVEFVEWRYYE